MVSARVVQAVTHAELQPEQFLRRVNGQEVGSFAQAMAAIKSVPDRPVTLTFQHKKEGLQRALSLGIISAELATNELESLGASVPRSLLRCPTPAAAGSGHPRQSSWKNRDSPEVSELSPAVRSQPPVHFSNELKKARYSMHHARFFSY